MARFKRGRVTSRPSACRFAMLPNPPATRIGAILDRRSPDHAVKLRVSREGFGIEESSFSLSISLDLLSRTNEIDFIAVFGFGGFYHVASGLPLVKIVRDFLPGHFRRDTNPGSRRSILNLWHDNAILPRQFIQLLQ